MGCRGIVFAKKLEKGEDASKLFTNPIEGTCNSHHLAHKTSNMEAYMREIKIKIVLKLMKHSIKIFEDTCIKD